MASFEPFGDRHSPAGHWSGHYHHDAPSQAGRSYPIHAYLSVIGRRIEGAMSDEVTDFAYSLRKVLDNARGLGQVPAPVFDEMLRLHPDALMESTLPSESVLRGRIRGDAITFTKTYEGPHPIRVRAAGLTLGTIVRQVHRVHYSGVFDAARGIIEGTWLIPRRGLLGRFRPPLGTGTFSLARDEG